MGSQCDVILVVIESMGHKAVAVVRVFGGALTIPLFRIVIRPHAAHHTIRFVIPLVDDSTSFIIVVIVRVPIFF